MSTLIYHIHTLKRTESESSVVASMSCLPEGLARATSHFFVLAVAPLAIASYSS